MTAALAILAVYILLIALFSGVGEILARYAPERDEDEELRDHYRLHRRLPL